MSDIRGCSNGEPHERHPWDENVSTPSESRTLYHDCPGVPGWEPITAPVDVLFAPAEVPATMEVLTGDLDFTEMLMSDGEAFGIGKFDDTAMDYPENFTYNAVMGCWDCIDCRALTVDADGHAKWHERTQEALTRSNLID